MKRLRTHCPQAHALTPENTYIAPRSGARCCRICRRAAKLRFEKKAHTGLPVDDREDEKNSAMPPQSNHETNDDLCECPCCGRTHRHLGTPPWALNHDDLCRLSRLFGFASDLRTSQDQRINGWLSRMIGASVRVPRATTSGESP